LQGSLRGSAQGSASRRTKGFVFCQLQGRKQHGDLKIEKAAGPERPASAAGIGPFSGFALLRGHSGRASGLLKQRRMNMPLIASEPQGKKSALRFEIDSETKHTLKLYCEFSENLKHDPVIVGALKLLFKTDADFAPWLEQRKRQQAGGPKAGQPKSEQK
jgi:hypothetical protein